MPTKRAKHIAKVLHFAWQFCNEQPIGFPSLTRVLQNSGVSHGPTFEDDICEHIFPYDTFLFRSCARPLSSDIGNHFSALDGGGQMAVDGFEDFRAPGFGEGCEAAIPDWPVDVMLRWLNCGAGSWR